jgi:hypothetical protein
MTVFLFAVLSAQLARIIQNLAEGDDTESMT